MNSVFPATSHTETGAAVMVLGKKYSQARDVKRYKYTNSINKTRLAKCDLCHIKSKWLIGKITLLLQNSH